MPFFGKMHNFRKSLFQLNILELTNLAIYKLGLSFNLFSISKNKEDSNPRMKDRFFVKAGIADWHQNIDEGFTTVADQILEGKYPLFGGSLQNLDLEHLSPLKSWQDYELGKVKPATDDIKKIWEPARFGWAVYLAVVFEKTRDERYAVHFLELLERFLENNPPYLGPNWTSGQEAAIRIICITYCMQFFSRSASFSNDAILKVRRFLFIHAKRIPPTLSYARAQNNNHLLLEAVGLITAGSIFEESVESRRWVRIGWRLFKQCIQHQFAHDGEYVQHSTNYHRMALQAISWALAIAKSTNYELLEIIHGQIFQAAKWLKERVDPRTGRVPNYGHNDGTYLIPLSSTYENYLPVLDLFSNFHQFSSNTIKQNVILRSQNTWARMQGITFYSRPAHADQLHVDLWHNGQPITLDAGTYAYNLPSPWDNPLASTRVHNTLAINEKDQMLRAGKFLWLDWAQAKWTASPDKDRLEAEHNGYQKLGLMHVRVLTKGNSREWTVEDTVKPIRTITQKFQFNLHWLLPDRSWKIAGSTIIIDYNGFSVTVNVNSNNCPQPELSIVRGGEIELGAMRPEAYMGWYSPTYLNKNPALSLNWVVKCIPPVNILTTFTIS